MSESYLSSSSEILKVNLLYQLHLRIFLLCLLTVPLIFKPCIINLYCILIICCNINIFKLGRNRCCNCNLSTLLCILCMDIKILLSVNKAYNMVTIYIYFKYIIIITVIIKWDAANNLNLFLVSVFKAETFFLKYQYQKVHGILTAEAYTCCSPLGSEHTHLNFQLIILPESVSTCKGRKCSVRLVITDSHLLHEMLSVVFCNNPRCSLSVICMVAHRVIPSAPVARIINIVVLSHG